MVSLSLASENIPLHCLMKEFYLRNFFSSLNVSKQEEQYVLVRLYSIHSSTNYEWATDDKLRYSYDLDLGECNRYEVNHYEVIWHLNLPTEEIGTWTTIASVLSPLSIDECEQTKSYEVSSKAAFTDCIVVCFKECKTAVLVIS